MSCDLVVAARNAKLGVPEVRHNLLASCALVRLPHRLPYHLAMELVLPSAVEEAPWFERHSSIGSQSLGRLWRKSSNLRMNCLITDHWP